MTEIDREIELRRDVLLTFQVALLGMVTRNLRGVTVSWTGSRIEGLLFFDGILNDAEIETASDIEAELMASFPDCEVLVTAIRLDPPAPLNARSLEAWVYRRRE